jgi:hypothetical protein
MKPINLIPIFCISIYLLACSEADAQKNKEMSLDSAETIIKATYGSNYEIGNLIDADIALSRDNESLETRHGYIFEDPSHTMQHKIIITLGKRDSDGYGNDSGAVAILKDSVIVWCSKHFIRGFIPIMSMVRGFCDLNNDGITDIIVSAGGGSSGEIETLWLVSPDVQGGRLLNAVDDEGYSVIIGGTDTFEITNSKQGGKKQFRAIRPSSETLERVDYTWQGSVYNELKSKRKK